MALISIIRGCTKDIAWEILFKVYLGVVDILI